jgi:hypothetical protein
VRYTASSNPPARVGRWIRESDGRSARGTQVVGFLTLAVSGAAVLVLLTGAVLALVFLGPLALLTSPIWVPVAIALFVLAAAAALGFVVAAVAAGTWTYRYVTGRHPVGADRVDYARSQIASTAREYGGYLHAGTKDAAPGA